MAVGGEGCAFERRRRTLIEQGWRRSADGFFALCYLAFGNCLLLEEKGRCRNGFSGLWDLLDEKPRRDGGGEVSRQRSWFGTVAQSESRW
ncbi:unnamed protein product [Linum trigynum]|uniref:Uncharacterized protein n=1 Tax=Linum trigynum TaxID=586398 RepID=A0AAV2F3H3_9ROSI